MDRGKRVCSSNRIPPALGPYSQAVAYGDILFCSGIIPMNPETGQVVSDGIEAQTHQVLTNLAALLEDAGTNLDSVLKTTVFLQNLEHFHAFNEVYGAYFPANPPARSTVQVARLPMDVLIEVEAIAALCDK
jgi:2-iminobutanoate/2-iminopropanoate deaminase